MAFLFKLQEKLVKWGREIVLDGITRMEKILVKVFSPNLSQGEFNFGSVKKERMDLGWINVTFPRAVKNQCSSSDIVAFGIFFLLRRAGVALFGKRHFKVDMGQWSGKTIGRQGLSHCVYFTLFERTGHVVSLKPWSNQIILSKAHSWNFIFFFFFWALGEEVYFRIIMIIIIIIILPWALHVQVLFHKKALAPNLCHWNNYC